MSPVDLLELALERAQQVFPFLVAVLIQVTLWSLVALLIASAFRRYSAALRHAILLAGLLAVALAPAILGTMRVTRVETLNFNATARHLGVPDFPSRDAWLGVRLESQSLYLADISASASVPAETDVPASSSPVQATSAQAVSVQTTPPALSAARALAPALAKAALFLISIWSVGMAVRLVGVLRGLRRVRQIFRTSQPCTEPSWQDGLTEAMTLLGLRRRPRLLLSPSIASPLVIGIVRPAIVLPAQLQHAEGATGRQSILLHEAAHILRRDTLVGLIQRVVDIMWWFNPVVTYLNQRLSRVREEVCDNYVLRHVERHDYAETLVRLSSPTPIQGLLGGTVGMMEPRWPLEARIRALLDGKRQLDLRPTQVAILMIVATTCLGTVLLAGVANRANDVVTRLRSQGAHVSVRADDYPGAESVMFTPDWKGSSETLQDLTLLPDLREIWFCASTIEEVSLQDLPELLSINFQTSVYGESAGERVRLQSLPIKTIRLKNLPKLNPDLHVIDTQITALQLEEMEQLKTLRIEGLQLTDNIPLGIGGAPNLEEVRLSRPYSTHSGGRTQITDAGLAPLAGLKHLRELGLNGARITDRSLPLIGSLTKLKSLELGGTEITDAGIGHLASLTHLTFLAVGETEVTDAGLRRIVADHPQLEMLFLAGSRVTSEGLSALKGLPKLQTITLDVGQLSDESCAVLSTLSLQMLCLTGPAKIAGQLSALPELPMLLVEGVKGLTVAPGSLKNLKSLLVYGADRSSIVSLFQHFDQLEQLEQLIMLQGWTTSGAMDNGYSIPLDDQLAQQLAHLAKLKGLFIEGCARGIGDQGIACLKSLPDLESVHLVSEPRVTNAGFAQLANQKSLKSIMITDAKLTDEVLPFFRSHEQLREMNLVNSAITPSGVKTLTYQLPEAKIQAYDWP